MPPPPTTVPSAPSTVPPSAPTIEASKLSGSIAPPAPPVAAASSYAAPKYEPPPPPVREVTLPGEDRAVKIVEDVPQMDFSSQRKTKSKCEKCGKEIAAEDFGKHMKICLLNKDWLS